MTEARKLLIRALDVLEEMRMTDSPDWELGGDIRAELQKPEPVEWSVFEYRNDAVLIKEINTRLPEGKYRLLAEKIEDEQKI